MLLMSELDALPPRSPSRRRNVRRGGAQDRRSGGAQDGRAEGEVRSNLPAVIAGAATTKVVPAGPGLDQVAEFTAQLIGQGGVKRGLRGGAETLDKARSSYLGAEWSGQADRRPPTGRITKTEI